VNPEHGLFVVLGVSVIVALVSQNYIYKAFGLKLAIDAAAITTLGYSRADTAAGFRVLTVLLLCSGTLFLFVYLLLGFKYFKAGENEKARS
jgi:hypothetical protein